MYRDVHVSFLLNEVKELLRSPSTGPSYMESPSCLMNVSRACFELLCRRQQLASTTTSSRHKGRIASSGALSASRTVLNSHTSVFRGSGRVLP